MAITTAVTRKFDNNYVQVDATTRNGDTKYYKLPAAKADSFQKEYIQNSKEQWWKEVALTTVSVIGAIILASLATKKVESSAARMAVGVGAGAVGGIGSGFLAAKMNVNSHQKLLKKYGAEQLYFEENRLPI